MVETRLSACGAFDRKRARGTQDELPDAAWRCNRGHEPYLSWALDKGVAGEHPQERNPRLSEIWGATVCSLLEVALRQ